MAKRPNLAEPHPEPLKKRTKTTAPKANGHQYQDIRDKEPENPDFGWISTVDSYLFRRKASPYNPDDLVGRKGLDVYTKMRQDEQVKAALAVRQYAVLATGSTIEKPEADEEDEAGKEMADTLAKFVEFNFEEMEGHFDSKIVEFMEAHTYGFAVAELGYFPIDYGEFDGKVGLKDIRFRKPKGIEFDVDEFGDLLEDGIVQGGKRMPKEKFALYSYRKTYSNFYGQSELREVYRGWWTKDIFQRFMAIALERYGEPIWVFTHTGRISETQRAALKDFIKNLQSKTGIIIPENVKADPKAPPPRTGEAFVPAIQLENSEIRMGLLLPGLLGLSAEKDVGSLARSGTEFDVFLWIVGQLRKDIETVVDEQVIKRLIDLNYEVTGGKYPKFKFNAVTEEHKQNIFKLWLQGVTTGGLTKTREDEGKARTLIEMPPLPEETPLALPNTQSRPPNEPTPESLSPDGLPSIPERQTEDILANLEFSKKKEYRAKSAYEKRVDFAAIKKTLTEGVTPFEMRMRTALKESLKKVLGDAELYLKQGLTPDTVLALNVRTGEPFRRAVVDLLQDMWRKGRDQSLKEVPPKVREGLQNLKNFQIGAGFEPREAMRAFETRSWLIQAILDERLRYWARLELFEHLKGGRPTIETIKNLREIFEPYVGDPTAVLPSGPGVPSGEKILEAYRLENVVRTESAGAYNQGRLAVADASDGFVTGMEYSAILDSRVTEICSTADGLIMRIDDPRLKKLTPPNHFQSLPVGTMIATKRGPRPIEELHVGMKVLTHKNRWRRITETMKHETWPEEIVVYLPNGMEIIATDDHPILTQRGWVMARDLTKSDSVVAACGPCQNCGKITRHPRYCGRPCADIHRRMDVYCIRCGAVLVRKKQSSRSGKYYCSRYCMYTHRMERNENKFKIHPCPWCRRFTVNKKYCSKECLWKGKMLRLNCRQCGKEIGHDRSGPKSKIYCSRRCAAEGLRKIKGKTCAQCGKPMVGSFQHPISINRTYCSRKCYLSFKGRTSLESIVGAWLIENDILFIDHKEFGIYVVDFYLPEYRIVIEADGSYWHIKKAKREDIQRRRREVLAERALIVVRLSEEAIKSGGFSDLIREAMERYEQAWKNAFPFSSDTEDRAPSLQ